MRRLTPALFMVVLALFAGGALAAESPAEGPAAVSPGRAAGSLIGDGCPTFSWGAVEGAKLYDLVVYRVEEDSDEEKPVLRLQISGSALNWTPSLDHCLERGGRYGWSVRALGDGRKVSGWSAPNLFEVVAGPTGAELDETVTVVRQYLEGEGTGAASGPAAGAAPAPSGVSGLPGSPRVEADRIGLSPRSVAVGDSALLVNGSPVLTTETVVAHVAVQLCEGLGYRYVDRNDGTVLDCNTGLLWLKDANCFSYRTLSQALIDVTTVADGACGLTDGSLPGDWRLPEIGEFCSRDDPVPTGGLCLAEYAADSLSNGNYTSPSVSDASGDEHWVDHGCGGPGDGDPFCWVQNYLYWSATESAACQPGGHWSVDLWTGVVIACQGLQTASVWPVRGPT